MTPFFSVILPSYNVEKYLDRCVKSFLTQSFTDYEIIIVDDGSTDHTGEIAELYVCLASHPKAKKNTHFRERIRATIYEHKDQYISCGNGSYRLSYQVA